jgi:sialate O-acetylesterase
MNKREVGNRLAFLALHDIYGKTTIEARGPEYKSMRIANGSIYITFDHAADGFNRSQGIEGFEIAGEDKVFHPARAIVRMNAVVLSSDKAPNPVAARYCFRNFQPGNLYGMRGLPAVPFRTDTW